ncbi:hypothetical protein B7486_12980 [cyanobacterium TDX16]|nr:hypothetical protein B7486_12980 [cyanobacterium TDX16]
MKVEVFVMGKIMDRAKSVASKVLGSRPSSTELKDEIRRHESDVARLVSELDRAKAASVDAVMDAEGFAAADAEVRRLVDELAALRNRIAYLGQARLLAEREERGAALERAQRILTAELASHKAALIEWRDRGIAETKRHTEALQALEEHRTEIEKKLRFAQDNVKALSDDAERDRRSLAPLHRARIEELQAERDELDRRVVTGDMNASSLRGKAESIRAEVNRWRTGGDSDDAERVNKEFGKEISALEAEASRLEDRSATDRKRLEEIAAELHRLGA